MPIPRSRERPAARPPRVGRRLDARLLTGVCAAVHHRPPEEIGAPRVMWAVGRDAPHVAADLARLHPRARVEAITDGPLGAGPRWTVDYVYLGPGSEAELALWESERWRERARSIKVATEPGYDAATCRADLELLGFRTRADRSWRGLVVGLRDDL